jgi:hypothetical protein
MNNDDVTEYQKVYVNKLLFSKHKQDNFDISTVLDILDLETLPLEIPINNNMVFIRDLTKYIVKNKLKPYINE